MLRSLTDTGGQRPFTSRLVLLLATGTISILAVLASSVTNAQAVFAQENSSEMRIEMTRGGTCEGGTCTVALDGAFTLAVEIVEAPSQGYIGAQSFIEFGADLVYNMTEDEGNEIVWPDCASEITIRAQFTPETVNHGCLTGLVQPLPLSTYTGTFAELSFTCSSVASSTLIKLLPLDDETDLGIDPDTNRRITADTSGAGFASDFGSTNPATVNDLTVDCVAGVAAVPTLTPAPTVTPGGPTNTPLATRTPGPPPTFVAPTDSDTTPGLDGNGVSTNGTSDADSGDDDDQTILIVAIIIAIIVIGGGGAAFFVRRQRESGSSEPE